MPPLAHVDLLKRILVPLDLGEPSRRALDVAVALAEKFEATITIVHVFDVPMSYGGIGMPPRELLAPIFDADRVELDTLLAEVRKTVPSATLEIVQGVPWREVLAAIERIRPDLVVMGTSGRRGLGRALLGSVTEKIVRLSPAPVLSMRVRDDTTS